MSDKLARFTQRARRALSLAQDAALRLNHREIDAEHLLLGLAREEDGTAVQVLRALGVEPGQVIRAVERAVSHGERQLTHKPALTARTKRVIELAAEEARQMGHPTIGTEHLLLGLVYEGEGVSVRVLQALGIALSRVRPQTERMWGETKKRSHGDEPR
jgi:ATP-dependent Clp protease ATP-binding subunit ClpC